MADGERQTAPASGTEWVTAAVDEASLVLASSLDYEETLRNVARLAAGRFTQTLLGNRLRVNVSPDLSVSSYVQYDTDSDSVGVNTRLRWTLLPVADLFVVYNHNVHSLPERWELDSNQLLIKLQYAWRL